MPRAAIAGVFALVIGVWSQTVPALSELEQLRRENAYLQSRLARTLDERDDCRVELAPLRKTRDDAIVQRAVARLKADFEAAHPGFTFNTETGALEPVPDPPVAPKP
jgi:hypothetical protein